MERHEEKEKSETETPLTIEDFTTEESIKTVKVTVLYYKTINTECWPHTIKKGSVQYMDFDLLNFVSRPLQDPASTCVTLQIPMEIGDVAKQKRKVGSSTKKILLPTSYILDSDGVWNRSFWSEGPKNHLTLKTCVSKFVPRDLKNWRTQ